MLLILKGIKQMENSSIQFINNEDDAKNISILATSSPLGLIKLQIFLLALNALKEEKKEVNIENDYQINNTNENKNESKSKNESDVHDKNEINSNNGINSINILALRLMKYCLPNNLNKISLANTQAWNLSVQGPQKSLNVILIELLRSLSDEIRRDIKSFQIPPLT